MQKASSPPPYCFGKLENVFPEGEDGLRNTPESCVPCCHITECLRAAMADAGGLKLQEKNVDRAYAAGMLGFLGRWSRKKDLQRRISEKNGVSHEND
ncbi:MAG: hypothetical protein Q7U40_00020 [Desulfatirhabdiaceae bacterium]|nr:hypothetical protein [Desulfatirhabdiaceae bacterium]